MWDLTCQPYLRDLLHVCVVIQSRVRQHNHMYI